MTILYFSFWFICFLVIAILSAVPIFIWKSVIQGMTFQGAVAEMRAMFIRHFHRVTGWALWIPKKLFGIIETIPVIGPVLVIILLVVSSLRFLFPYIRYVIRASKMERGEIPT